MPKPSGSEKQMASELRGEGHAETVEVGGSLAERDVLLQLEAGVVVSRLGPP